MKSNQRSNESTRCNKINGFDRTHNGFSATYLAPFLSTTTPWRPRPIEVPHTYPLQLEEHITLACEVVVIKFLKKCHTLTPISAYYYPMEGLGLFQYRTLTPISAYYYPMERLGLYKCHMLTHFSAYYYPMEGLGLYKCHRLTPLRRILAKYNTKDVY